MGLVVGAFLVHIRPGVKTPVLEVTLERLLDGSLHCFTDKVMNPVKEDINSRNISFM